MIDYKKLQNGSDIRGIALDGVAGEKVNLTKEIAGNIAIGFAAYLKKNTGKDFNKLVVAIGRDPRISGSQLASAFATALSKLGIKVLDAGLSSTPAMFMSTIFEEYSTDGAVMITASHLPFNRNGFKFFTKNGGLDKGAIKTILEIAASSSLKKTVDFEKISDEKDTTNLTEVNIVNIPLIDTYADHLRNLICEGCKSVSSDYNKPLSQLAITVDAGNGAGGFFADKVLKPLGADISSSQFLEPDGTFPNHQPNPENKEAMESIKKRVLSSNSDLGLIFDTDVDRSSAVDEKGNEISRNGIVAMAAALIAEDCPSTTVVTDSITSPQLTEFLENELGLKHLRFKRGYKNVISKAQELNDNGIDSQLAIETSGHAAYKENYFLDDGAYLATKIVIKTAILKAQGLKISSVIERLAEPLESTEIRFPILENDFSQYGDRVLTALELWGKSQINCRVVEPNFEGVRLDFGYGWLLLRKSLHDPIMPLNVESSRLGGLNDILSKFKLFIKDFDMLDTEKLENY